MSVIDEYKGVCTLNVSHWNVEENMVWNNTNGTRMWKLVL